MRRQIPLNIKPRGGVYAPPFLAMILLTLCLAGCSKTSEEPTSELPSTPAKTDAGLPKLVDLGATACVPCKKMAPILDELEVEYVGVLDVSFIDVWQPVNKVIAESYEVEEIPTQIFLDPEGNELWRHVGFIAKADILAKWEELGYDLKPGNKAKRTLAEGNADLSSAPDDEGASVVGESSSDG